MLFLLPVSKRYRVTQEFGSNPAFYQRYGFPGHEGIDWAVPVGTPVTACADGVVIKVFLDTKRSHPYGVHVRLRHHLDNAVYETIYAHLKSSSVRTGDVVKAGDVLGLSGNTGNSTGPHLHLTIIKRGATASKETHFPKDVVDPRPLLKWE